LDSQRINLAQLEDIITPLQAELSAAVLLLPRLDAVGRTAHLKAMSAAQDSMNAFSEK
jgi:hypothetical protein